MENRKNYYYDKPIKSYKEFHPDKSVLYNTLAEFENEFCEDEDSFFDQFVNKFKVITSLT